MSGAGRTDPGGSASGTRFLENLAYLVPGYRGYKEKELRREEDARCAAGCSQNSSWWQRS